MTLEEMKQHEWIVSWSGGKDSTATIILMREYNIPIKEIIYVRMMYDETLPATLPIMTEFVNAALERFKEWGYRVRIVNSIKHAVDLMSRRYFRSRYPLKNGSLYGITAFSRRRCMLSGIKAKTIALTYDSIAFYMVGYAADEKERLGRLDDKKASIMLELNVTEKEAFDICERYGLLSPLYSLGIKRDGCWFCPNAGKREREVIKEKYPELYQKILDSIQMCSFDVRETRFYSGWIEDLDKKEVQHD